MSESRLLLGDGVLDAPAYTPDADQTGEWHRRVVECLFHCGFDAAGLVHMPQVSSWGVEECTVCLTGRPIGEPCWYCNGEGVAA